MLAADYTIRISVENRSSDYVYEVMGDVFGGVRGVVHNGRHRGGFVFFDDLDSRGKFILLGTKKGFRFSGLIA